PIGSSGRRMSAKMMAASTAKRRTGWSVTSTARAGVLHTSRMLWPARTSWYSARYRPAWRMNHTGVQSTGSRRHARRKRSFIDHTLRSESARPEKKEWPMIERDTIYIDGAWVPSGGAGTIDVHGAATEEVVAHIPEGVAADVDRAVA